jgi:hypothetical protein
MVISVVILSHHPRPTSLLSTISPASETPLFLLIPLLPSSSALFSAMAPTHLHSSQALTHSFYRDGGCTPSRLTFSVRTAFSRKRLISKSILFCSLRTLSFSVSRNSCICHSYEKCRVYTNSSHSGTRLAHLAETLATEDPNVPTCRSSNRFLPPSLLLSGTFKRSNVPTLFVPLFTLCVLSCTVFPQTPSENGMVMSAYHVLHTGHSRFQFRRSPEITWN